MSETPRSASSGRDARLGELLSPAELAALEDFCAEAEAVLGSDLLETRLYGSRARDEGGEDSDLDLALVVTAAGRERRREVQGLAFDVLLRHGVMVSPLVIAEDELARLRDRERRIAVDLEREGIPV